MSQKVKNIYFVVYTVVRKTFTNMSETKSENVFRSYKKQLIKKLGKKGLYDTDINTVGKDLFGLKWLGCHASDKIIVSRIGYQIINVDTSKQAGSHWIGIFTTHKKLYIRFVWKAIQ